MIKNRYIFYLLLISIFFIILPPFYIVNKLILIPRISELIWLSLFFLIFTNLIKVKLNFNRQINTLLWLSLIIIISQTLSIIFTIDLKSYLFRYEILVFSYIFLLLMLIFLNNHKQIKIFIKIIVASFLVNILIQIFIYFYPSLSRQIIFPFLQQDTVNLIEYNLLRGRVYLENFNFVIIPLLFYFLFNLKNLITKTIILGIISLIIINAYASNFRTVFLLTALNVIFSLYMFRKQISNKIVVTLLIFLLFSSGMLISNKIFNFNVIDRLLLEDVDEDYKPITGRLNVWVHAYEVGRSSPVFGVGLGNYSQYSPRDRQISLATTTNRYSKFGKSSASEHPHNIFFGTFAESGILGLLSLISMLIYFGFTDIRLLLLRNNYLSCFIVGFWSLFAYSLLNPATGIRYSIIFWLFRILVLKVEENKSIN